MNDNTMRITAQMSMVEETVPDSWLLSGRYRLLHQLGQGGMGKVFLGLDTKYRSTCAIKIMHNHLRSDSTNRLRFEREAELAVGLKHHNVLNVTGYGVTEANEPYIVMEYLAGESLDDLLKNNKFLELSSFKAIFQQICSGLQYAHESGVVHRDMKPSNVMLLKNSSSEPHVKIVDFGIAKVCKTTGQVCPSSGKALNITQPGEIFGSPLYMSPEQCFGEEVNCQSEVYSLGCMMFEVLTGDAPWRGKNARETLMMKVQGEAPRLTQISPQRKFSKPLEDLVARCLQREPADRFQSIAEVHAALSGLDG